eukprot:jgi/Hompol1/475/HPOL_004516-RA
MAKKGSQGGSAVKRLKETLKTAGIIGAGSKVRKVSKKRSAKAQIAAATARKEAKTTLRQMAEATRTSNPFEMKFAKPKHDVMGRRIKGVTGRPGQTKKRSEEIRKQTLLVEMKNKHRETSMLDRRIGEHDPNMSLEDKMLERYMREKSSQKRSAGGSIFNLEEDDQELTHMGKSLSSFDAFDDAGFEKVDDDSDDGNIDAKIVKYTHFGGFDEDKSNPDANKSRNEIMKEIISKSKSHKRERQKQKEEDIELQNEVDKELDEIRSLLAPMSEGKMVISSDRAKLISGEIKERPSEVAAAATTQRSHRIEDEVEFNPLPRPLQGDDYDRFVRELTFDRRAQPTDRIKTSEEIALAEKLKLEKLEQERIRRMKGIEDDDEDDDVDGGKQKKRTRERRPAQADDLGDDDYSAHVEKNEGLLEPEFDFDQIDGDGEAPFDSYSEDNDEEDEEVEFDTDVAKNSDMNAMAREDDEAEAVNDDVPYVIEAPKTLDDFLGIIRNKSHAAMHMIAKRLRILNNARLGPEFKQNLEQIAMILLEHRDHVTSLPKPDVASLKALEGHAVELGREFSARVADYCVERIVAIQDKFVRTMAADSKKKSSMPNLSDLYFFRIIGEIFSASDLHHVVVTPAILVASQFLAQCPVNTAMDALSGLFLCEIVHDFAIQNFSVKATQLRMSMLPSLAQPKALTDEIKVALLAQSMHLLSRCSRTWNETGCSIEIFAPTMSLLTHLDISKLTGTAHDLITAAANNIQSQVASAKLKRRPLQMQKRKAIPIPTFVPKFEEQYSHDKRSYDPDRERAEASKLRAEVRKEKKGAIRELRKDAAFVARQQIINKREQDAEYKKKISKIMGQLANQEGAMRGFERETKKKQRRK